MRRVLGLLLCGSLLASVLRAQPPARPEQPGEPKGGNPQKIKPREVHPRELQTKGWKVSLTSSPVKPAKITSAGELAKLVPEKEIQARLLKEVDFKQEYLLVFAWSGSGEDNLSMKVEKGKDGDEAVFSYKRGVTLDLRRHLHIFAIPKGMASRIAT